MVNQYYRYRKPRRSRWLLGLFLLILVVFIICWLLAHLLQAYMNPYTLYTNQMKIVQVRAIRVHEPGYMNVELKTFASDGRLLSDNQYLLKGNEWRLEGELIVIPDQLNFTGAYSGYKLIQVDGRYVPSTISSATSSAAIANEGDDEFFKKLYSNHVPVIQAYRMYSNFMSADGKIYNIFIIGNGLSVESTS